MMRVPLDDHQRAVAEAPLDRKVFLEGPAGSGKTTAGVARLLALLDAGVPASAVLVMTPTRTLAAPYDRARHAPAVQAGGEATVITVGGLARRMVDLFWPLVAEAAGFAFPDRPPTFLTLETAQYYMARLVAPLLDDEGYFETVTIERNRLYSQIIDNLNKSAVVGFPPAEIGARLKASWTGDQSQRRIYDEVQACADLFRAYCLGHNLLDFSLQIAVFRDFVWPLPQCRAYLTQTYAHLIFDNIEEDTPAAYDLTAEWLPAFDSALLIYDQDAGNRRFLGADPELTYTLSALCDDRVAFAASYVTSPDLRRFAREVARSLHRPAEPAPEGEAGDVRAALTYAYHYYHPQMLDWAADEVGRLVHVEGVPPGEIAVLAPFLTDALRFALMNRLERDAVPVRSHRPSRALRDEPATQCLLTLAALAHPDWGVEPTKFDVAYALMQAIDGLDLVRAQLLADIVYRFREEMRVLHSFSRINAEMQGRITFLQGGRYEGLRTWTEAYLKRATPAAFDHFLSRLFGEVISQAGYGFHHDFDAGRVATNLIESVQKFRWAANPDQAGGLSPLSAPGAKPLGQEYVEMVRDGVIAAQYVRSWQPEREAEENTVLLAPAYTFLMRNQPVRFQFWLNVGGSGWWERLYQPLTHPYVLSRAWQPDRPWTDADEVAVRQEGMYRLILGLIRRCRERIYLGLSELSEQGFEQKGQLLGVIQRVLRHAAADDLEVA
ncbi:MAG: hypothetical protein M5R40_07825 [Anaerolineae bacterium]|nr:hypothetical protein [Anaerolineae bacterium]